jgi:DUF1365 family protein
MDSALYLGNLRHRRFAPRPHAFSYPVYMAFLDIDRLPELLRVSPLSSYNRWNLTAYCECDHFGNPAQPLRQRLEEDAAAQGLSLPDGQIFLLTHLRYFGYVFNPVSFYYFYDRSENLAMLMAEVNSTFGERNNYWLTADSQRPFGIANRYTTPKEMHVSPFMGMDLAYDWIFTPPAARLVAHMNVAHRHVTNTNAAHAHGPHTSARQNGQPFFDATLELDRHPWEARALHRALASYPLMTLRVIAGIHWQALRLWLKHVPVFTQPGKRTAVPAAVANPVVVVPSKGSLLG